MENIKNIEKNIANIIDANGEVKNINDVEIVGLDEVVEMCSKFLNGEIEQDKYIEWINKIVVLYYLPIKEKYNIIQNFLINPIIFDTISGWPREIQIELSKWFYMMLEYTNIEVDGYEDYITLENYDITVRCLGNVFEIICGKDYNRLLGMYESIMNVENTANIIEMISNIPVKDVDEISKDIQKVLENIDEKKDVIDKIIEINKFNNNEN